MQRELEASQNLVELPMLTPRSPALRTNLAIDLSVALVRADSLGKVIHLLDTFTVTSYPLM
jgi:hypothetical protein